MLVMTMDPVLDNEIVIGRGDQQIVIKLLQVRGNKVRLGFDGPADVPIDRARVRASKMRGAT